MVDLHHLRTVPLETVNLYFLDIAWIVAGVR
jgi:hypothetical protein